MALLHSKIIARYRVVRATGGYYIADENEEIISEAFRTADDAEDELNKMLAEQIADELQN